MSRALRLRDPAARTSGGPKARRTTRPRGRSRGGGGGNGGGGGSCNGGNGSGLSAHSAGAAPHGSASDALSCANAELRASRIHKLLLIVDSNAHQFLDNNDTEQTALHNQTALFERGSKITHSCRPNLEYNLKRTATTGAQEHIAIRPIEAGDELTDSYITDYWTTPTLERRAQLLYTKDFVCGCERCCAPDDCRGVRCLSCSGLAFPPEPEGEIFFCVKCGPIPPKRAAELARLEVELAARLGEMQRLVEGPGGIHAVSPSSISALAREAAAKLSPVHYLVPRVFNFAADTFASHASALDNIPPSLRARAAQAAHFGLTADTSRVLAATMTVNAIQCIECISAGCGGGAACDVTPPHPVVHECAQRAFWAGKDLLSLRPTERDQGVARLLARYFPAMAVLYGEQDPDLVAVRIALMGAKGPAVNQSRLSCEAAAATAESGGVTLSPSPTPRAQLPSQPVSVGPDSTCDHCGGCPATIAGQVAPRLQVCSACKCARYCSQTCQRAAWKQHKRQCGE
mmetsp:Transcript_44091/g.101907  ORF Transcript_44091/g.101907 Transcript_44091/m.101907 type:complete len:516 (-) Transcript_44091:84-1631(-)